MKKTIAIIIAALTLSPTALAVRPSPAPAKRETVRAIAAKSVKCNALVDKAVASRSRDDFRRSVKCERELLALLDRL